MIDSKDQKTEASDSSAHLAKHTDLTAVGYGSTDPRIQYMLGFRKISSDWIFTCTGRLKSHVLQAITALSPLFSISCTNLNVQLDGFGQGFHRLSQDAIVSSNGLAASTVATCCNLAHCWVASPWDHRSACPGPNMSSLHTKAPTSCASCVDVLRSQFRMSFEGIMASWHLGLTPFLSKSGSRIVTVMNKWCDARPPRWSPRCTAPAAHQGPERRQRRFGGDRRSGLRPRGEDHGDGVTGLEDTERRNEKRWEWQVFEEYIENIKEIRV